MNKINQSGSALIIGIVIFLVLIGGGVAYFVANDSGDNTNKLVTTQSEETAAENPEKAAPAESKSLPNDYPSEAAPIYQPSTITMATKIGNSWMVSLETDDDIKDVAKAILNKYETMGAKVSQTPFNDEGVGQVAGGNAGYGVIITYNTDKDKNVTSVSYHVDPQVKR